MQELPGDDGLAAAMIRMAPQAVHACPDPRATGGQYLLVANGSLGLDGAAYRAWSPVFVAPDDGPLTLRAGPEGLEALYLQFPRPSA